MATTKTTKFNFWTTIEKPQKFFKIFYAYGKPLIYYIGSHNASVVTYSKASSLYNIAVKATICWNHVFHQKFPKMVCGRVAHYHYPLYTLKGLLNQKFVN